MMVQENPSDNNNNNIALQEDVNSWDVQDSMSLSSLSLQNKNVGGGGGSGYVGDELYDDHKSSSSCMLDIHCDERNELGFEPEELVERRCVFIIVINVGFMDALISLSIY